MTDKDGRSQAYVSVVFAFQRFMTDFQSSDASRRDARARPDREYKDRVDRLRNGAGAAPSPLKTRKSTGQGSALPNASNQAIVGVSAPSPLPNSRRQSSQGHPFANVQSSGAERHGDYDPSTVPIQSQAGLQPISPMNVNNSRTGASAQAADEYAHNKSSGGFMRFITCGCCR